MTPPVCQYVGLVKEHPARPQSHKQKGRVSASVPLICAAMEVCTLSLACCSMNLGRFSTTFLMDPVLASPVSRAPLLADENSLAFSASEQGLAQAFYSD